MATTSRMPKTGDAVVCDGATFVLMDPAARPSGLAEALWLEIPAEQRAAHGMAIFENPTHQVKCAARELRWSDELEAWYLWGRLLSREQKHLVAQLRDAGELPARETRIRGAVPAGGEHLNLYCALFHQRKLSRDRQAALADYGERFNVKLTEGFADPDADDSWEG